jgi:CRP-like cAMP-binding protein
MVAFPDEEVQRRLERLPMLQGMDPELRRVLIGKFGTATFAPGAVVLAEGVTNSRLFAVVSGALDVKLLQIGNRMCEVDLGELYEGDVFGEYSIFDGQPVCASVITKRASRVAWLEKQAIDDFLDAHPRAGRRLYDNLMRMLIARLRSKNDEVDLRKVG